MRGTSESVRGTDMRGTPDCLAQKMALLGDKPLSIIQVLSALKAALQTLMSQPKGNTYNQYRQQQAWTD